MEHFKMNKQKKYDILLANLDYLYKKTKSQEEIWTSVYNSVKEYMIHVLRDTLEEGEEKFPNSKEVKAQIDEVSAEWKEELEESKKRFENIDRDKLKNDFDIAHFSLLTLYKKQLDCTDELKEFHEKEKYNAEVKLTLKDDFLPSFKEVTLEMLDARKRGQAEVDDLFSRY